MELLHLFKLQMRGKILNLLKKNLRKGFLYY